MNMNKLFSALRTDPSFLSSDLPLEIRHRAIQEKLDLLVDIRELNLSQFRTKVVIHCEQNSNLFVLSCAEQIGLWMFDRQCQSGNTQGYLLLEWLSKRPDATASTLYNLAIKTQSGVGCGADLKKAFNLLKSANEIESKDSYLRGIILQAIGNSYFDGCGVMPDLELAIHYFQEAAIFGFPDAVFNMGLYYSGNLVELEASEFDYEHAARCYESILKNGHVQAQTNLGILHLLKKMENSDTEYGRTLLKRSIADRDDVAVRILAAYDAGELN